VEGSGSGIIQSPVPALESSPQAPILFKFHFNIIATSTLRSPKSSLPIRYSVQCSAVICFLVSCLRAPSGPMTIFLSFRRSRVLKWGLLFDRRRSCTSVTTVTRAVICCCPWSVLATAPYSNKVVCKNIMFLDIINLPVFT
jgi:hypothetical protein